MAVNILLKRSSTPDKRPDPTLMLDGEVDLNYDAGTGGLFYKDSAGDVVKVGPCQVSSTAPNATPAGSPGNSVGEFWFNTNDSSLNVWDGTAWVETNVGSAVQGITGTLPITVDNTDPTNPIIEIDDATTSAPGAVQLNDTVTSTSTSQAATANAVKTAYDAALNAVQTVSGTTPVQVDDTDPQNLIVSVDAASVTAPGIVQLNNTTSSTSTTEALTANQGYLLQQQIDALVITNNLTLAGTYNADTGLVDNVTPEGAGVGFVNGDPLPAPDAANSGYFVIVDVQGSTGPSGAPPYHIGDWFLSDGTDYLFLNVGFQAPYATESVPGIVQLATDAEVQAGTDTEHAVVPSSLQSKISDSTSTTSSTTIASSTAVKAAYDLADAAVPDASFTAAGDLLVGSGAGTYAALSAGAADTILSSDGAGNLVWIDNSAGDVTSVSGTAPITVDNTNPQTPIIGIDAATTTASGAVQLYDDVDSTSNTLAATANAVKIAYDAATAASAAGLPTAGGTMTGNITFSAGTTIEYADVTPGTVIAADQLATVVDESNGNLVIIPGFDAGSY